MEAGNQSAVDKHFTGDETTDRPGSVMMLKSPWMVLELGIGGGMLSINKIFNNEPEWLVGWHSYAEDRVASSNSTDTELPNFQHGRKDMCIKTLSHKHDECSSNDLKHRGSHNRTEDVNSIWEVAPKRTSKGT